MTKPRMLKIKRKISFITIAIIILISIFISIIYFYEEDRIIKSTNSELRNTNLSIVNMVKTSVKTSVRSYLKAAVDGNMFIIKGIYSDYKKGIYTKEKAMEIISRIILSEKIGKTGYSYIVNSKGVILIHPKNQLVNEDLSQYEIINRQKKEKTGYVEYDWKNPDEKAGRKKALYMEYFKEWDFIVTVSAYRDEFDELINTEDFKSEVLSVKFGENGYAYVITDKGIVKIHPNLDEGENWYTIKDSKGNEFIKEICARKNGTLSYFWQNPGEKAEKEKLVVFQYIPELKWIVASGSYKDEYLKPLRDVQVIILFAAAMLLFLYLLQEYLLTKVVIKPIYDLVKGIRLSAKLKDYKMPKIDTNDEIGELSEEFSMLLDSIHSYDTNLENMVELRTRELNKAYEEIKRININNEKKEKFLRTLIETIPNPIFYKDESFRYIGCNSAFEKYIGKTRDKFFGKTVYDIAPKEFADKYNEKDIELKNYPPLQNYEAQVMDSSGKVRTVIFNKAIYSIDDEMTGIVGVIVDITETKSMERMLGELTVKDALTGLFNKKGIEEFSAGLFEYSAAKKNSMGILLIDIDNFKEYNNKYGHNAGDECLKEIAKVIKSSCNKPLDFAGRFDDDNFIAVLFETDENTVIETADKIINSVNELAIEYTGNVNDDYITVSIGGYIDIPKGPGDRVSFIQKAENKLKIAKEKGKGVLEI